MLNTINNTQSTNSDITINVDTEPKINFIIENQPTTILPEHKDIITLDVESGYENNYNKLKNKPSINGKTLIGDISTDELGLQINNASGIKYEDNFDNDVVDVQEALDVAFSEILNLRDNLSGIEEYENATIDLATFPVGVYYLKGIYTKIKYDNNKTVDNIIKSDDQKVVLVTLGGYGTKGKGIIFSGAISSTQVFIYVFGNGLWTNYNVFNFLTSSKSQTITANWTFNALPVSSATPTSYNQLVTKKYVDNKFNGTDLGYIDLDEYDGDVYLFMGTITNEGKYIFTDSYDEFVWFLEVETAGNRVGQRYWYQEEGFMSQYYRDGSYNEDEDRYEWNEWINYMDWNTADYMFARKDHYHYSSVTTTSDIREWLDRASIDYSVREYNIYQNSDKKLFYVRVFANNYVANNTWKYMRYQEYYDIEEPSKVYKRAGTAKSANNNASVTWGNWYTFEGIMEEE